MNQIVSKAAIHCVGPTRTGYGEFLDRINEVGRKLSVIKVRDEFSAVGEPLRLWPEIMTIGAKEDFNGAPYDVDLAYTNIVTAAQQEPRINYWEYFNEINGDWTQQTDLYIALMPRLTEVGIGLCIYNCASGTPQYPEIDPIPYSEVARACKVAKDNNYKVILGLHEYVTPSDTIGRFKRLADYLESHNALIPIVITEYGYETFPGDMPFMQMVETNDPIYISDPRVIGCALWTLGGGGWGGSNYQTALPELGEYIATIPGVAPIDHEFDHWLDLDTNINLGTTNPLSFTITSNRRIQAITRPKVITYTCQLSTDGYGKVTGDGIYPTGTTVIIGWNP